MAGFGTKGRLPGSEDTPVHGAVDEMMKAPGEIAKNIGNAWGDVTRGIDQGARDAFEGGASNLRGVGHSLFGEQTAIGGALGSIFGGGSEQAASPATPAPARPVTQPTSMSMSSSPAASARPLVVSPTSSAATGQKAKRSQSRKNRKGK